MGTVLGRVLVIDDDPFMLKIIRELLEKAGFVVLSQGSPSGAAQTIVSERVDAAVIDWNLPGMQGDDMIRSLRTWEVVKSLPVLLISGAPEETLERIREQLPGVRVLAKTQLRSHLVSTLGSVVGSGETLRGLSPVKLGGSAEQPVPPLRPSRASDLVPQLLAQLAQTLPLAKDLWNDAAQGRRAQLDSVVRSLDQLAGQARLLALEEAASLLQALSETLSALPPERKVAREVRRAIEGGLEALSGLTRGGDGAFTVPPEPLIGALHRACSTFPPVERE